MLFNHHLYYDNFYKFGIYQLLKYQENICLKIFQKFQSLKNLFKSHYI
jgi:hypothetical protein